jgi:hypothetical protein
MSTSTQVTDYSDLYSSLLEKARENSTAALIVIAKQYIQQAHMDLYIGNGEKFHWAERRAYVITHAEYSTGTIAATQGSATLTGTSTVWTTNNAQGQANMRVGGKLVINGTSNVYEVTAVSGAGTATISPVYSETTASGLTYKYYEDEYALEADFSKPIDARRFDDEGNIRLIGRSEFRRMFLSNKTPGTRIMAATLIDRAPSGNTTPIRKLLVAPPPSDTKVIPYSYVTANIVTSSAGTAQAAFSATTDEPIIPLKYRHVIVLKALEQWYLNRKDDQRAQLAGAEYRELLARMVEDHDIGADRLRLKFNRAQYRMRAKHPRGRGMRFDYGGRFDRFQDD